MTAAINLIRDALESLGVYAPGEPIDAEDATLALQRLTFLIDSWTQEHIYLYQIIPIPIPLVPNESIYTIGSLGGINGPAPEKITHGTGAALVSSLLGETNSLFEAPIGDVQLQVAALPPVLPQGALVLDLNNPPAIPFGTTIIDVPSLGLSQPILSPGVGQGDIIAFGSVPNSVASVAGTEWRGSPARSSAVGEPITVFYEKRYPLGVFHIVPIPGPTFTNGGWVIVQGWYPLFNFQTLTVPDVVLSPGEDVAIVKNLAIDLKSYFSDAQIPPSVAALATITKQNLKYTNLTSRAMMRRSAA